MRKLKVGIVGGGIGGVALSASLRAHGIEAHIFERAPAFGEVGAGIQMTPNAVKILRALGMFDELEAVSFLPQNIIGRDWKSAREMWRTPLARDCPRLYGAPFFHVHRADLHRILLDKVDLSKTALGVQCTGARQEGKTAVACFADGSEFEADVIVGADGIHSTIRKTLFGDEPPRFTGNMCWRAVVPFDTPPFDFVSPDSSFWLGPKGHVVTYYVSAGRAVNIVAVLETKDWVAESWNVPSSRDELLAGFKGWHENLQKLFSRADEVFKWGLFDRDPMPSWTVGHMTLLGDAAHPMLPFLSQGAAMAIEDGFVLAGSLADAASPGEALQRYESLRRPRTTRVQLESRERGRTYHLSSRFARIKRDLGYRWRSLVNPQTSGLGANWVYEYDAQEQLQTSALPQTA
ncbi:salicylate 1-monooxygenase (NahW) [Nitratireductor indicus C115]|uniref:Salicylate 1-monooxygenase (NahW) n=1 Tax=Nitratireductor indicus C115 TaxID=1231190 RepID=K2P2S6_9HYPH|nr:FAD-dependent monooxygenase [Nitratireductor indicus]EKF41646.1 salicylate 1-monooxygenase (NahW) [Nitratireductor indicus C115]SFQ70782.1 salicylate hydroxylase [Nitratireductor indicus]